MPVARRQFLGGDIGASDAQRYDLAGEEREDEAPCPQAQEAAPRAMEEGPNGGVIDRGPGDILIVGELVLGGKLPRRGLIVDCLGDARQDVGHGGGDGIRRSAILLWSLVAV